uniref:RE64691p n=1 Tax=Drosophila melanogaster TaxID=7227 RepID=E1NZD4_DROME|nr:RE64691p [Drosophila melanogaster]
MNIKTVYHLTIYLYTRTKVRRLCIVKFSIFFCK